MNSNIIWEDLKFFLDTLKNLPISESLTLSVNGSYCVSTGTASENWVYCPEREISPEIVNDVVRFFCERDEAFMWPVYDGGTEILEVAGVIHAGDLAAMCIAPEKVSPCVLEGVTFEGVTGENAGVWAKTMWQGFGGEGDVPEGYCRFAGALACSRENVSLFAAKYFGEYAGAFAVTHEPELAGVYYFATVPNFRRKGVARAMMSEICRLSAGKNIVLQSTPMGMNFYRVFGFTELFRIPVYSTDSDIL